jgi:hypothetical protein
MQMLRNVSASVLACLITLFVGVNVVACRSRTEQEITKVLAISDVKTGWYDAGVENGMNKLVPTVPM